MKVPLPNSYWVLSGRLLAGEYPYGAEDDHTGERIRRLEDAGIDYFIDLTEEGERPPYRQFLAGRTGYLRHAIADAGVPGHVAQMRELQSRIRSALTLERRIYLHCRAGIGRTALVVGCYLVDAGLDGRVALQRLNSLWRQSEGAKSWRQVPQTPEQAEYIRRWPQHRLKSEKEPDLPRRRS